MCVHVCACVYVRVCARACWDRWWDEWRQEGTWTEDREAGKIEKSRTTRGLGKGGDTYAGLAMGRDKHTHIHSKDIENTGCDRCDIART